MKNSDEINDMKVDINNLQVQLGVLNAQCKVLHSCFMEVIPYLLPKEQGRNLYTNLVNDMEERVTEALDNLQPLLYDTGDHAFLVRQKFEMFEAFQAMKQKKRYLSNEDCDKNAQ